MNKITNALSKVVDTLKYYEKDYVSAKRNPIDSQERSTSMSHYLECRINFEFFKIDEFRELEEMTDGHLFVVKFIEGEREKDYDIATIVINDELNIDVSSIIKYLGGRSMSFSSNKDDLNLIII